jgi:RNA-directed DNA polymerase
MISKNQPTPVEERIWKESEDVLCEVFCHALGITKGEFYHILHNLERHYRRVPKTTRSGKQRIVYDASKRLRSIHNIIKRWLEQLPVHDAAHGWIKGRSSKTAASMHLGQLCVNELDITDCYPSISHRQVYNMYARLGCVPDVARVLTILTTWEGHLAQGLITSQVIANQILSDIDSRIETLCRRWKFTFCRYGDNIVVSGSKNIEPVVRGVKKILSQSGFQTKEKCVRQMREKRQIVLGIVVNTVPNLPKKQRRVLRAMANNCLAKGWESEQLENEDISSTKPRINGHVSYLAHINPQAAQSSLRKLHEAKKRHG